MKRIVCYCLAISMIQQGSSETDCAESQLLVKETKCSYANMSSLTMYILDKESKVNQTETTLHKGCDIEFDEPLNSTFYIKCEIEETDCYHKESETIERDFYHLECEDVDLFGNNTTDFTFDYTNDILSELGLFESATTTDLPDSSTHIVNTSERIETTVTLTYNNENNSSSEGDVKSNTTEDTRGASSEFDQYGNETTIVPPEIDVYRKQSAGAHTLNGRDDRKNAPDNVLAILGYSVAALGATVGVAFGAYQLKNWIQSGTYLFPETPSSPGFMELA